MDKKRDKLTVLIPCKNESQNIRACIESVRGIADEILVADSGSTDGTLEIARKSGGCQVIQRDWQGYANFKNWAMSHAQHPWILLLDADERLTPELSEEIRTILSTPEDGIDAYKIPFETYFLGHRLRFSSWNKATVRLVRRGRYRFEPRRVHERLNAAAGRVGQLKGRLLHFSVRTYDQFFAKYAQYSQLAAQDLWEVGKRATVYSLLVRPFLRFLQLYLLRGGFLDGLVGVQVCMLMAFFYSFSKQARLWEMQAGDAFADLETASDVPPPLLPFPGEEKRLGRRGADLAPQRDLDDFGSQAGLAS